MNKTILLCLTTVLFLACTNKDNNTYSDDSADQNNISSENDIIKKQDTIKSKEVEVEVVAEPISNHEFAIKITDLTDDNSTKFSIVVIKNNEVVQNIETPEDMDDLLPFDRRFFTTEDVNFDGYEDFYFTDFMGMVNSSKLVYLYNPNSEKFELDEDYRSITSPQFDPKNQIITSFSRGSAASYESETYIVLNNKLTRVSKSIDDQGSNTYGYTFYDGKKEVAINEELRKVKLNIAFFKTQKFNIVIDLLENDKYRYVSWGASKNPRNNPDLNLKNGVKEESENEITYIFKNGDFSYVCIYDRLNNNGHLKVFQNEKELLQQEATVFIMPNEVEPYQGGKNKLTLDID